MASLASRVAKAKRRAAKLSGVEFPDYDGGTGTTRRREGDDAESRGSREPNRSTRIRDGCFTRSVASARIS